jgi:alkaline phosphatase D
VAGAALAAAGGAAAAAALAGPAGGFPYGVAAGEIRPTEALLWTRAPAAGPVRVELSESGGAGERAVPARATGMRDLTVSVRVRGLRPATVYRYRFRQGDAVSPAGSFRTAPRPDASASVRFALTGDADATRGPDGRLGFGPLAVYGRMAQEGNDFNVNLGDTIYSDSPLAPRPRLTLEEKRSAYRELLSVPAVRHLRAAAGLYSHWDDHEFVNDFSVAEHGRKLYEAGVRAFAEYAPVRYAARTGLYRTFRWGRHLELFFLDARSFRSAKARARCGSDPAPALPGRLRQAFSHLAAPLARPVAPACLAALADPARTLLGEAQLAAFLRDLRASTATFKVVVNEVPLLQLYLLPYDRWEGYAAERARVLAALARLRNVVVLTTDTHASLIGEVRTRTLEGSPAGTGIPEVVTGPAGTRTFARAIDLVLGRRGAGALVTALFFKAPPPAGLGLACAATDVLAYVQVEVTPVRLTVTPRTASGGAVREQTGARCGPLVVAAR